MFCKNVLILLSVLLISAVQTSKSISHSCNPPDGFEEKLNRVVEYLDTDQDGVVTAKELDRNTILFDHNLDCFVSPYEFVSEWTCRYGDKPDVAYRIFNQLTSGTNLLTFDLYRDTENQTVTDFRNNLYSFYTQSEIQGE